MLQLNPSTALMMMNGTSNRFDQSSTSAGKIVPAVLKLKDPHESEDRHWWFSNIDMQWAECHFACN